jgi:hypothetical protein
MPITYGVSSFLLICGICAVGSAGIAYALSESMELLGRLCAVVGISLVLTLLLLVLYQDEKAGTNSEPLSSITASATAPARGGTP